MAVESEAHRKWREQKEQIDRAESAQIYGQPVVPAATIAQMRAALGPEPPYSSGAFASILGEDWILYLVFAGAIVAGILVVASLAAPSAPKGAST